MKSIFEQLAPLTTLFLYKKSISLEYLCLSFCDFDTLFCLLDETGVEGTFSTDPLELFNFIVQSLIIYAS